MTGEPSQSQPYPGETDEMRSGRRTRCLTTKGADVAISYLKEDDDARHTHELGEGRRCLTTGGEMYEEDRTRRMGRRVVEEFGAIDVLVLRHSTQRPVGLRRAVTDGPRCRAE
jgi:NAD(P)-dependent dehydrogenase (short-subunit alcohol dehydrogenase family)